MLRDIHLIGALIPPRRPHPRCRRPAALAHLAVILDRAKRRSGLLKPFARGPDGMSQHSPITLRFCQSRSEEHTSEFQSLMRISYAVFCLKKKKNTKKEHKKPHKKSKKKTINQTIGKK